MKKRFDSTKGMNKKKTSKILFGYGYNKYNFNFNSNYKPRNLKIDSTNKAADSKIDSKKQKMNMDYMKSI